MENGAATIEHYHDQNSLKLDLKQLDASALAGLKDTALGAIIRDMKQKQGVSHSKHSSHSSYTEYSTYSMGPIR